MAENPCLAMRASVMTKRNSAQTSPEDERRKRRGQSREGKSRADEERSKGRTDSVNSEIAALIKGLVGAGVDGLVERVRVVPDSSLSIGSPSSHRVVGVLGRGLSDLSGEEVCG